MSEIWKDIKDYEGLYQVSNLGRVKILDRIVTEKNNKRNQFWKGHIVKATDNGRGYQVVSLRKDGKRNNKYVHRLVAEAFIPNPENKKEVNHKDLNKRNNCLENLEWVSQIENKLHFRSTNSYEKAVLKAKNSNRKRYEERINKYKAKIIELYKNGHSIKYINAKTGICKENIARLLKKQNIEIRGRWL